jgi:hypothetical protein
MQTQFEYKGRKVEKQDEQYSGDPCAWYIIEADGSFYAGPFLCWDAATHFLIADSEVRLIDAEEGK